jgi:hypothetical protein
VHVNHRGYLEGDKWGAVAMNPYRVKDWKAGWPPWHRAFFFLTPGHGNLLLVQAGKLNIRLFSYNLWGWRPRLWSYRGGTGMLCTVFAWVGFDVNYARQ